MRLLAVSVLTSWTILNAGLAGATRPKLVVAAAFAVSALILATGLALVTIKEPGDPRVSAERAVRQLAEMEAVLRDRQAELTAARRLIRGWRAQIERWLQLESAT
jgi:hypothetical protein